MSTTLTGNGRTCDIDILNAMLRVEVSAAEVYDEVLAKFDAQPMAAELRHIRDDHWRTANLIRERVTALGGTPVEESGPWGAYTVAEEAATQLVGPCTVLAALIQGEEYGINQYESILSSPNIDSGCKEAVISDFLPKSRAHIAELDRVLGGSA